MSLSGSAAEGYGKTGDGMLRHNDGVPPAPTPENPAGVAPQVSSTSAPTGSIPGTGTADDGDLRHVFGNPMLFNDTFGQLSTAFTSTLAVVEGELPSGLGSKAKDLIERLKAMRAEIDGWREGEPLEGGAKKEETNDVSRESGEQSGGLYAD